MAIRHDQKKSEISKDIEIEMFEISKKDFKFKMNV